MSRISLADPQTLDGPLAAYYRDKPDGKLDVFRLIANAPTCAMPYLEFMKATFARLDITGHERELLVLAVSHLEQGEYEWVQHVHTAETIGIPKSKVAAIADGFKVQGPFTEKEWALLNFVREVVQNVRVKDDTFNAMAQFFNDRQIVETILTIGGYITLIQLTEVARLKVDRILGPDVYKSAIEDVASG
ncbi:MAG: carboxymuconolactone decarboxylase family protein [Novosphingobium sp.]